MPTTTPKLRREIEQRYRPCPINCPKIGSNTLILARFHQSISGDGEGDLPFRFPAERGQPRCAQRTSQAAEVSLLAGFRGVEGQAPPKEPRSRPAANKQGARCRMALHTGRIRRIVCLGPVHGHGSHRPPGGDAAYRRFHRYPASAARFRPRAPLDGPPGAVISHRPRIGLSGPHARPHSRRRSPPIS